MLGTIWRKAPCALLLAGFGCISPEANFGDLERDEPAHTTAPVAFDEEAEPYRLCLNRYPQPDELAFAACRAVFKPRLCDGAPCGGLHPAEIRVAIERHWSDVSGCYEQDVMRDPNSAGKLTVVFNILGDGGVDDVSTESTGPLGPAVVTCVQALFREFRFPKPLGGQTVNVRFPFLFKSETM